MPFLRVKTNVRLDTEKRQANREKIADVNKALSGLYPSYYINSGMLCPSFLYSVREVEGLNNFIASLGYARLTKSEHALMGEELGRVIRRSLNEDWT